MTQLHPDFKDFLRLLNEEQVEYLLIGGYAVGIHGYPRATADIDFWIAINPDNAQKVTKALARFGFGETGVNPGMFQQPNQIIRMGLPPYRIEISTGISGVIFEDCYQRRLETVLDGVTVNVISLQDLKINKRASGRNKDLADLDNLP